MGLAIKMMALLMNLIYAVIKFVVPTREEVVLISRQSNIPSLDFQLLNEELSHSDLLRIPYVASDVPCRGSASADYRWILYCRQYA